MDFSTSGQEHEGLELSEDDDSLISLPSVEDDGIGVSIEKILKMHSSDFFRLKEEIPFCFIFVHALLKMMC